MLPQLLSASDVVVLPSEREGLANIWIETLACGTPLVIPDIGGARQDETLARAGAMLELYGQREGLQHEAELRSLFDLTGSGDHRAMLRFMNWAAGNWIERPRMVAATGIRGPQPMSRSQRLYRNSIPTNGAA